MLKENMQVLKDLNVDKWNEKGYTGKGVKVVILDVDCKPFSHMENYLFDMVGSKESGHGAEMGFTIHEIVSDVKVHAFSRNESKAYEWVKEHKNEIDLINISMAGLDGSKTPTYERFKDLGIPVICASGNDGFNDKLSYPANYDWTVGTGGFGKDSNGEYKVDRDSNGGADLDIVAPYGIRILGENNKTWTSFGTSISSAVITGMLSCYIQLRKEKGLPKINTKEVKEFLKANSTDILEKGFDNKSGYGVFKLPLNIFDIAAVPEEKKEKVANKANIKSKMIHIVRPTNTVSGVSKLYGISKEDLRKWNNLKRTTEKLKVGTKLFVEEPNN